MKKSLYEQCFSYVLYVTAAVSALIAASCSDVGPRSLVDVKHDTGSDGDTDGEGADGVSRSYAVRGMGVRFAGRHLQDAINKDFGRKSEHGVAAR